MLRAEVPEATTRVVHAHGQTTPAALFAAQVERPTRLVLEGGPTSYLDLAAADTAVAAPVHADIAAPEIAIHEPDAPIDATSSGDSTSSALVHSEHPNAE